MRDGSWDRSLEVGEHGNFVKNGVEKKAMIAQVHLTSLQSSQFLYYSNFKTKAVIFKQCVITQCFVNEFLNVRV